MSEEFTAELTLKDRLNYPYLLANQILTFQKSILNMEYPTSVIREAIEGFVHLIPESWKDEKFLDDIKKAMKKEPKDNRPIVAGNLRMNEETCKALGIEPFVAVDAFDYYMMFQACVDLLDRRGLTSKRTYTEKMTGNPYQDLGEDVADSASSEV